MAGRRSAWSPCEISAMQMLIFMRWYFNSLWVVPMCCSQEEIDKVRKRQAEREAEKARREEELVGGGERKGGAEGWWGGRGRGRGGG